MVFDPTVFLKEPVYNRNLKEIISLAGITKNVSHKVARHTNAQLWIRYCAEGPVLSKMLGHTKQETTKNYYDVNIPQIVEGTKRADFKAGYLSICFNPTLLLNMSSFQCHFKQRTSDSRSG